MLQYFNHKEAKNALDKALELAGIRIELGGALGKTIRIFRLLSLIVRLFERDDQNSLDFFIVSYYLLADSRIRILHLLVNSERTVSPRVVRLLLSIFGCFSYVYLLFKLCNHLNCIRIRFMQNARFITCQCQVEIGIVTEILLLLYFICMAGYNM